MNKACQLAVFFIFVLHFQYLDGQPYLPINSCYLMHNGRSLYESQNPDTPIPGNIPSNPLYFDNLPIEFHLNDSIPQQYRDVFGESASEWNIAANSEMIRISDEIDHSDVRSRDFKNVIYWLNDDQYNLEDITLQNGAAKVAAETFIEVHPVDPSSSYIFIADVDIIIYEEQNVISEYIHQVFTRHLKRAGIEPSENMNVMDFQRFFIDRLSNMSSDNFYEMVAQMLKDKGIILMNKKAAQSWVISQINAQLKDIELTSFEDLQALMIEGLSSNFASILNSTVLLSNNILHEFGHALGLKHNNVLNSLMHSGFKITLIPNFFENITVPKQIDRLALQGLLCSYNHLIEI